VESEEEEMTASGTIYDSPRLAAGYAYDRPPVHRRIIERVRGSLGPRDRYKRALDIGCGAGLSTAAIAPLAEVVIGLEPVRAMVAHHHVVAPGAIFLVGQAERLPFRDGVFDLMTAAGAINYADLDLFLPEAARVLAPDGRLIIYDFSAGRRLRDSAALQEWYSAFERRYPAPTGYALDVQGLAYNRFGLRLDGYEAFEVAVPMTLDSYLSYALSETSVELALSRGAPETELRDWCQSTLANVFGVAPQEVLFDAYVAYVNRDETV
jgi:SAM-dependent methyltransferase